MHLFVMQEDLLFLIMTVTVLKECALIRCSVFLMGVEIKYDLLTLVCVVMSGCWLWGVLPFPA